MIGLQNIGFAGSLSFSFSKTQIFYKVTKPKLFLEMEQHRRLPHAEVVQLCLLHVPGWAELDPNSVEIEETDETEWHQARSDQLIPHPPSLNLPTHLFPRFNKCPDLNHFLGHYGQKKAEPRPCPICGKEFLLKVFSTQHSTSRSSALATFF